MGLMQKLLTQLLLWYKLVDSSQACIWIIIVKLILEGCSIHMNWHQEINRAGTDSVRPSWGGGHKRCRTFLDIFVMILIDFDPIIAKNNKFMVSYLKFNYAVISST